MKENYIDKIFNEECLQGLKSLPDNSIDCCVTSPPYYALRDYGTGHWEGGDPNCPHYRTSKVSENTATGHKAMMDSGHPVGDAIYKSVCPLCGAIRVDEQIGLEETPEEYIRKLTEVFMEVHRVLKPEGTLWLNIGDSYVSKPKSNYNGKGQGLNDKSYGTGDTTLGYKEQSERFKALLGNYKNKDLIGIPWMLAFSLRNAGWYLRQDIIWCLSGGAYVYVKSQKGVMPMMIKDLVRLDPKTIQLWNGNEWVNVLGYGESNDTSEKIEIVLRSGERIGCTGGHKWVLSDNKEVLAKNLRVGDILKSCALPNQEEHKPSFFNKDLLWFLGLYLAEGSLSDDCIQIALNVDELSWVDRITSAANHLGGSCTHTIDGNKLNVRVYSQVLLAVLHQYIGGHNAKTKHLNNICWQMPNDWLREIVVGYLDGDGHFDTDNNRIRLGFTRNYDLERDLRVLASRLGATITLKQTFSYIKDKKYPSFKGEWRWKNSNHFNVKDRAEIVDIRKSRARHFYDIAVDSEDHLFSLASGILTHNCKPNPMPEPVKDRCVKSHEYIFLMSKSQRYYFDYEAIQEPAVSSEKPRIFGAKKQEGTMRNDIGNVYKPTTKIKFGGNKYGDNNDKHFQTYSGKEWQPQYNEEMVMVRNKRDVWSVNVKPDSVAHFATYPEELITPCILAGCPSGGLVLDPFMGSGTTARVARKLNRHYVGFELNAEYCKIIEKKIQVEGDLFY